MNKIDIMYDHYKDTFSIQKETEKVRNKLFVVLCICILLLLMMTIYPDNIYQNIQEFFDIKLGINIKFELKILELFNWFIILYLTIRYYQTNANVEKNYNYIHDLEDKLEKTHKLTIYREGRNYLNQYPLFLTISYVFYKYIFPIVFSLCIITKNVFNFLNKVNIIFLLISQFISLLLLVINVSYFAFNYKLRKEKM